MPNLARKFESSFSSLSGIGFRKTYHIAETLLTNLQALCLNAVFTMFRRAHYAGLKALRQLNIVAMPVCCHKGEDYAVLLRNYRYIDVITLFLRRHCENYAVIC
jgi:midasin (ATPase involved in ribosome maturation)